jgi:hypothetical protein
VDSLGVLDGLYSLRGLREPTDDTSLAILRGLDGVLCMLVGVLAAEALRGLNDALWSFELEWRPSTSGEPVMFCMCVPETLRARGDRGERIVFSAVDEILLLRKLSEKLELLLFVSFSEGKA